MNPEEMFEVWEELFRGVTSRWLNWPQERVERFVAALRHDAVVRENGWFFHDPPMEHLLPLFAAVIVMPGFCWPRGGYNDVARRFMYACGLAADAVIKVHEPDWQEADFWFLLAVSPPGTAWKIPDPGITLYEENLLDAKDHWERTTQKR